jgi:uncharacterized protein YjiS (DUF1127 family)
MNIDTVADTRSSVMTRSSNSLYAAVGHLASLLAALENWRRREQASMQLAHLDRHTLRDAGISEARRFIAVNKPY